MEPAGGFEPRPDFRVAADFTLEALEPLSAAGLTLNVGLPELVVVIWNELGATPP